MIKELRTDPAATIPPVVVVGAGPTGLVAALLLAQRGVDVVVLERRTEVHPLPRAVHLDDEVHRILQQAGVAEEFTAISRPALGLRLLDARHRTMAEFGRGRAVGEHGWPQANMFDQPDLEALLRRRVAREPRITLRSGQEVVALVGEPRGVRVGVRGVGVAVTASGADTGWLRASAVLGCDGAGSTVRDLVGARAVDLGFVERWLVVDVCSERALEAWDGVHQVCDPDRAATYMRVGEQRYRWEFRLRDGEDAAEFAEGPTLAELLRPWTGQDDLDGLRVLRVAGYTFRARIADRWRSGRTFLLGDAAHETPPFVGQGLGSGLRDAVNLAWKLAAVLEGASDSLLDSYEPERRPHARAVIRTAVTVGWAMTGGQDAAAAVRRAALAVICRVPAAAGLLDRGTPPLRAGALVARHHRPSALPGRLLPQPTVLSEGVRTRLDDVLGSGFAVVTHGELSVDLALVAERLGAVVVPGGAAAHLDAWLRAGRAGAVIVRPDRVVLAAADRHGRLTGADRAAVESLLSLLAN